MSTVPRYPFYGDLARGISGSRRTMSVGGIKAVGKIVFTGNILVGDLIVINGVTFTAKTSGAAGNEFNVDSTLALSLAALNTVLNASVLAAVSRFTYTVTDTNTAITATGDNYAFSDNSVVMSSTHSTVVVTALTGGKNRPNLDTGHSRLTVASGTHEFYIPDGAESQEMSISQTGAGTANVKGANLPGSTVNYAMGDGDALILKFLGAKWRLVMNDGATAT